MNKLDKLRDIHMERIKRGKKYIEDSQKIIKHVSDVQRQIQSDEMALNLLSFFHEDVADKYAPMWLQKEENNNAYFEQIMPSFQDINFDRLSELPITTSGTVYMYASSIYEMETSSNINYVDLSKAKSILENYLQKLSREEYLPNRLELINTGLGEAFNIAIDSYNKNKAEVIGVDQVAIQLRDILQQVWGGLCDLARSKNTDPTKNLNHLELKKVNDRGLVAEILADHRISNDDLVNLLSDMESLHSTLSGLCKDPLSNDSEKLDNCYNQWIAILDRISVLVI